jgi:hypothetical protein
MPIATPAAVREASEREEDIIVKSVDIESYLLAAPQRFDIPAKVRKLLGALARHSDAPGDRIKLEVPHYIASCFAEDKDELEYLVEYAAKQQWITQRLNSLFELTLTPAGWEELQTRSRVDSMQVFVAMAFAELMKKTYAGAILPAVRDDCGYECKRIDAKEFNGTIMDEVKAEIRQSRFVIADVTHKRNGVYHEAGFADGLGVPVIWTCDERDKGDIHFDAQHLNVILWTSHDDLRKRLANRILATIGRGPLAPAST